MKKIFLISTTIACVILMNGCKKDEAVPTPTNYVYDLPPAYTFAGASLNYAPAAARLQMVKELVAHAESGNEGTIVSEQKLKNMFENSGNPFADASLNSVTTIKIKDAVAVDFVPTLYNYFTSVANASTSTVAGTNSVAGIVKYLDNIRKKLNNEFGYVPYEVIEKSLMGTLQYYQITSVCLSSANIAASVSKEEKIKNWDLAFGYLGVPIDYPNNTLSGSLWGEYLPVNDTKLGGVQKKIMAAFLTGRMAIENNDQATIDASALTIKTEFEKVAAGMALTYLKRAKTSLDNGDAGRRNNALSEGYGFIIALKYNASKKITDAQYNETMALIGTNNWVITGTAIQSAIDKLSAIYGLDANLF